MNRLFEAIANDEVISERWEELGITWHKVRQYLGLFCFLVVIYWSCLSSYVKFLLTESTIPGGFGFGDVMKPLVGTCLVSALAFGVLAYSDKTWRSGDAARVILGAGIVVYMGLSLQYKLRPGNLWVTRVLSAEVELESGGVCGRSNRGSFAPLPSRCGSVGRRRHEAHREEVAS